MVNRIIDFNERELLIKIDLGTLLHITTVALKSIILSSTLEFSYEDRELLKRDFYK